MPEISYGFCIVAFPSWTAVGTSQKHTNGVGNPKVCSLQMKKHFYIYGHTSRLALTLIREVLLPIISDFVCHKEKPQEQWQGADPLGTMIRWQQFLHFYSRSSASTDWCNTRLAPAFRNEAQLEAHDWPRPKHHLSWTRQNQVKHELQVKAHLWIWG